MPHVIIDDPPTPEAILRAFSPWKVRADSGAITEARAAYLRHDGRGLLVELMVLELGPAQNFFVSAEEKKTQLSVRCHPFPSPQRTDGVKGAVVRVARDILALGGRVARTNLEL